MRVLVTKKSALERCEGFLVGCLAVLGYLCGWVAPFFDEFI